MSRYSTELQEEEQASSNSSYVSFSSPNLTGSFVLDSDEKLVSIGKNVESSERFYENYDTIDWIRDMIRDSRRREDLLSKSKLNQNKYFRMLTKMWHAGQAWLLLSLIALSTAVLAAFISVSSEWLSDTRFGFCRTSFLLNRRICCRDVPDVSLCKNWQTWDRIFNASGDPAIYVSQFFMYIILSIIFSTAAAFFVKIYGPCAAGSGIPEVKTILGGFVIRDFLSPRTLLVKCVGLVLGVSSGLNLGKEGPLVHVASCTADIFSKFSAKYNLNQAKKRELISAAAAAGVSVAFGAPIGGVLFSLEEVSYYFPHKVLWRTFFTATLAAVILKLINPFGTGQIVVFQVQYSHGWTHYFELIPFMLIAIVGSLIGTIFIGLNARWCKFRKTSWLKRYQIQEVIIVTFITALISYFNPYTRGSSGQIISQLFNECDPDVPINLCRDPAGSTIGWLLAATFTRLVLVIFTFGVRVPAGIFIPALAIGASWGRAVGVFVQYFESLNPNLFPECAGSDNCINPGIYAVVGAAATLGGITRMTVSLTVIMFELTGDLSYIIPVMFAVMISKWVGDASGIQGLYDEHILINEYPFLDNKKDFVFKSTAREVMTSAEEGLTVLEQDGNSVQSLVEFLKNTPFSGFPIVNSKEEMIVIGFISRQELRQALENALNQNIGLFSPCVFNTAGIASLHKQHEESKKNPLGVKDKKPTTFVDLRPWTDEAPFCISSATPMTIVFNTFKKLGLRYVLVTDRGALIGIITKKDLLQQMRIETHEKPRKFVESHTGIHIE